MKSQERRVETMDSVYKIVYTNLVVRRIVAIFAENRLENELSKKIYGSAISKRLP